MADCYDRASDAAEECRAHALADVLAMQYAQGLRYMRRREAGVADECEECGGAIDGRRRREYPVATVCRECARGAE